MTGNDPKPYHAVIAGGGPVGLFLGLRLMQLGLNFVILEKRSSAGTHSRSIGIHPPSLELLDTLNLSQPMLKAGVCIRKGLALHGKTNILGVMNFELCPPPHTYILSLPQFRTEQILKTALLEKLPNCILEEAEVVDFKQDPRQIETTYKEPDGRLTTLSSSWLIGCDGKDSMIRDKAGIAFPGRGYPYRYAMGDYGDDTGFGSNAAIYLDNEGLVESFPLPGKKRRWVVEQDTGGDGGDIVDVIRNRTGHKPDPGSNTMYSEFKAERYMAEQFYAGRLLLAGDSAHLLSPIGGQGMNLGWLNAWEMADLLTKPFDQRQISGWNLTCRKRTRKAARRAECNMALGQKSKWPKWRNRVVKNLLRFPFDRALARRFTMRDL